MLESIPAFLSSLRQTSPVIFSGLAVAVSIILFVPHELASTLGIETLREENRAVLGFVLIGSVSILLVNAVWAGIKYAEKTRERRKSKAVREKYLESLTADEKAYLVPYTTGENTQYFQLGDGVVGGLEGKSIIYRASNVGDLLIGWAYNLNPWARDYLEANPHLLEGAREKQKGLPRY